MQSLIKSIFLNCAIIGLCTILPLNANAKDDNNGLEGLIEAAKIGEKHNIIPSPLTPVDKSPANPPNLIGCTTPSKGFFNIKAKCEYKSADGINYYLDENDSIYRIFMYKNKDGSWPKKLPFGINDKNSQKSIISKFKAKGYGLVIGSISSKRQAYNNADQDYEFDDLCFYAKNPNNGIICFLYKKNGELNHLKILPTIKIENNAVSDDWQSRIGGTFKDLPSPIIPIGNSPETENPSPCRNLNVLSTVPTKECKYKAADGLIYSIDYKGRIYWLELTKDKNGKFAQNLPIGVTHNDNLKTVQNKIKAAGYKLINDNYACYYLKNGKGAEICFGFDLDGKLAVVSASIWGFSDD